MSLDFYFFVVSSNFCFMKKKFKILHSEMKAGTNLAPTKRFSKSNGIGLTKCCMFFVNFQEKYKYKFEKNTFIIIIYEYMRNFLINLKSVLHLLYTEIQFSWLNP